MSDTTDELKPAGTWKTDAELDAERKPAKGKPKEVKDHGGT